MLYYAFMFMFLLFGLVSADLAFFRNRRGRHADFLGVIRGRHRASDHSCGSGAFARRDLERVWLFAGVAVNTNPAFLFWGGLESFRRQPPSAYFRSHAGDGKRNLWTCVQY